MALTKSDLIRERKLEKMVGILKAVAHPMRLQIVNILMSGECPVWMLVKMLGAKQSLTSQQLGKLKTSGIVKSRRNGNVVFYSLKEGSTKAIITSILAEIA